MKTGTYTPNRSDYWSHFFDKEQFMGINCEGFHNWATKHINNATDAAGRGYAQAKQFIGRRWYLMAVPLALAAGIGLYSTLMAVQPETSVQEEAINVKKRKKGYIEYWMKYYGQGKQKVKETIGGSSSTLDDKVDNNEPSSK